jgi:RHS repeat-associated protein
LLFISRIDEFRVSENGLFGIKVDIKLFNVPIHWLVTDQLGTPRMVFDQSGSLANVSRHDYLPFGEEIPANFRTNIPGYATVDNLRQKFTSYEADAETGLNFAQARYQSPMQGRLTSADPFAGSAAVTDPQTFNRYTYVRNNPVNSTDPSGAVAGRPGFSSIADFNLGDVTAAHANNDEIADQQEQWDYQVGETIKAAREANFLNEGLHDHTITEKDARARAAANPLLEVQTRSPQQTAQPQDNDKINVNVEKKTYSKTSSGLQIKLLAKVKNSNYQHFNWVQTVTTNAPLHGNPANQPYPDTDPGQQTPFYWNPTEQTQTEIMAHAEGGSTIFSDQPSRPYFGTDISWHANLSLVGIKSDGTFDTLRSYSYGFTINGHGMHLEKLRRMP